MPEDQPSSPNSFNQKSQEYLLSSTHREGQDLETLTTWVGERDRVLDVATGAGHVANALREAGCRRVVALDPAPNMVRTALREFRDLTGVISTAERLPFRDDSFDATACRIAAHHFSDVSCFLEESHRVIRSGGVLAFEDLVAPEDEELNQYINRVERLRDPTHVRTYSQSEWIRFIEEAGFVVEETSVIRRTLDYSTWIENQDPPETDRRKIREAFLSPPGGAVEEFGIKTEENEVVSWESPKLLIRASNSA